MSRTTALLALAVIAAGAGTGGYLAGQHGLDAGTIMPTLQAFAGRIMGGETVPPAMIPAGPIGPVIYYRDPDGKPAYSSVPKKTSDGRDFVAVHASEDVSFEPQAAPSAEIAPPAAVPEPGKRKILYYRNPMGLPDTSPRRRRIPWGWTTSPSSKARPTMGRPSRSRRASCSGPASRPFWRRRARSCARSGCPAPSRSTSAASASCRPAPRPSSRRSPTSPPARSWPKGTPLVGLYAREIASAGALYAIDPDAAAGAEGASPAPRRTSAFRPRPSQIIEKTGKVPISVTLTAPRSGVVLERMAVDGMMAEAGQTLFRIADVSTLWVMADVPEYELSAVRVGDSRHHPRPQPARPGVHRQGRADLSGYASADPHRPRAHRTAEPRRRAARQHVRRCRDRHGRR